MNNTPEKKTNRNVCSQCLQVNHNEDIFCQTCGCSLSSRQKTVSISTDSLLRNKLKIDYEKHRQVLLQPDKPLIFRIMNHTDVKITVEPNKEIIIGRGQIDEVHVNLNQFGGMRLGVSRFHATVRRESNSIFIIDLGSTNGTIVNGVKLKPHTPHRLQDRDEVYIGRLQINVEFT